MVAVDRDKESVLETCDLIRQAGGTAHPVVHRSRSDALCVLHTHTRAGCTVAAQEHGLLPLNQMSLAFYNRVGYHDYEGTALNKAEQRRLVANLDTHSALILRNHGLLTVGGSPAEAFFQMFYLNRAYQIQVDALAGNPPLITPPPDVCEHTATRWHAPPPRCLTRPRRCAFGRPVTRSLRRAPFRAGSQGPPGSMSSSRPRRSRAPGPAWWRP
ncbi:class II aldolase/adducin family protein [Saccharopolyspora shandongensis]|uniref:class II aldolase/adducin family protein n=1 Tax=Saccharopolyspora shandongensis TaxID=418495 RepID=UPI0034014108